MRKSGKMAQFITVGATVLAACIATSGQASAAPEWGGVMVKQGHAFTIRTGTSTGAASIAQVRSGAVPCTQARCVQKVAGSYTCWKGGPSGKEWLQVKWGTKTGWVARFCVEVVRYS